MFEKFANELALNGTIKTEEKGLYIYGLREGLIMLANITTTVFIGILIGMWWQSVVFLLVYSPLRSFAGGAHAKTHLRCYVLSILLTVVTLFVIKLLPNDTLINLSISLLAGLIIFFLAPVEDENKPLDEIEVKVYRERTRIILIIELLITIILLAIGILEIASCIVVSLAVLAIMLAIGKVKNNLLDLKKRI